MGSMYSVSYTHLEGYKRQPWTHQDRLDQFKFYGENKLNMYIYAPKDDPYHRDQWRDPYPQEEMARMQELINTANENKVDFVFAISPGKDIDINSEADYKALVDCLLYTSPFFTLRFIPLRTSLLP